MTDDLISRADAIEALEKAKERYFDRAVVIARMQDILRAIPSAQPKRGEWIQHIGGISKELYYYCNKCYGEVDTDEYDYCPHCGARMTDSEKPNNCEQTERSE